MQRPLRCEHINWCHQTFTQALIIVYNLKKIIQLFKKQSWLECKNVSCQGMEGRVSKCPRKEL